MSEHKYKDLLDQLKIDIQNGVYARGQKLPSENELADSTGYSRQTVRHAIGILEKEGFLVVRTDRNHKEMDYSSSLGYTYFGN
jgi:DNA-binding GntR family transcriptional regulator